MNQSSLESELHHRVVEAIKLLRTQICWKPDKDIKHLQTRQAYGHLPTSATLADYYLADPRFEYIGVLKEVVS